MKWIYDYFPITYIDESRLAVNVPIVSWCEQLEQQAFQQAVNLANHPAIFGQVAIMADGHLGYGMPIGGVAAFENVVVPNAVGKDIGCGMNFFLTDIPAHILFEYRDKQNRLLGEIIRDTIHKNIPVGMARHKEPQSWTGFDTAPSLPVIEESMELATVSLGTLGGGKVIASSPRV